MKNILIITGGVSAERDISLASYENIVQYIDSKKYKIIPVVISHDYHWMLKDTNKKISIANENNKCVVTSDGLEIVIDIIFLLAHGDAEAGYVQGVFENLNLKYVGTKMLGSVLCYDKISSKRIVRDYGIKVVPFIEYNIEQPDYVSACDYLHTETLVVKPSRSGSTFGTTVVGNADEFHKGIELAKQFDSEVIVERYLENAREVFCGYWNNQASEIGEVEVDGHEIFDYETKYTNNGKSRFVKARMDEHFANLIQKQSLIIAKLLKCVNYARFDFFIDQFNELYFSEVNTIPGMTNKSLFFDLMRISNFDTRRVIEEIIEGE